MLIDIVERNAEQALLSAVEENDPRHARGALYFCCSKLGRKPRAEEMMITVQPLLQDKQAALYFFHDGDLVITWDGVQKTILDDLCKRLYAHFRLSGNEMLHSYYDFHAHSEELRLLCRRKIEALSKPSRLVLQSKSELASTALLLPSPEQIAQFRTVAQLRSRRARSEILVVEDQAFSSKLLLGLLERTGKAIAVANAEAGLALYLAHAPDMVFLDIELPGVDGHQLAAAIHAFDPNAYIIMVSANHDLEDVTRAKENGAKGFIAKPYSKQKIFESIEKFQQQRKIKP